jgi:DNA-directed RNA polymerase specialized sigma24 family protein
MAALHRLPAAYQEVCGLFYFAERDLLEIAAATRRSRGAVKAMLFKARRAMVEDLRARGVLADEAVPRIR